MKKYYKENEWQIIEEGFNPAMHEASESIFSIGNGKMGQRANFEEQYSGHTLQGSYIAGIYYPDKTRVGWWKNGYPEYFAKVLNSPNWIGIHIRVEQEELDLATLKVSGFKRTLDMQHSLLQREFVAEFPSGKKVQVRTERFVSLTRDECGLIQYRIKPLNFSGNVTITTFIDGNVVNNDSNYDETFWDPIDEVRKNEMGLVTVSTRKTNFAVCAGYAATFHVNGKLLQTHTEWKTASKYCGNITSMWLSENDELVITKYASIVSTLYYNKSQLPIACIENINGAMEEGYDRVRIEHCAAWEDRWKISDIRIEGDTAAQQGIRFNILQLNHTYTGRDPRLNIGPKGFTGEKYGGSTYWDTEAYCIPFYLSTSPQQVARQLLQYRYNQLPKAIENAGKLGFKNGAALFPMVTMNGEESHNEWEITFEEIHRNGAIAYAIWNYINYTGDRSYLTEGGMEVLIAIARFWAQRVNWSEAKKQYVMLGVTGPNEYENNVNNNWYTNYVASWCLKYAAEVVAEQQENLPADCKKLFKQLSFDASKEIADWLHISANMFFPEESSLGIFLQQEGYMDKEQIMAADLPATERPINQHWSWDRILRSCFIKQADVLQGLFFFEDHFDKETLKRNFDFYEPRTVHESSLSPCIHAIQATSLGYHDKAYALYLRTSRLDLDDYNNEVKEGLHITSMAGTWMSIVMGFGGMRVIKDELHLNPSLPKEWNGFTFTIGFRGRILNISINKNEINIRQLQGPSLELLIHGARETLAMDKPIKQVAAHA